jgi:hypothetical protein
MRSLCTWQASPAPAVKIKRGDDPETIAIIGMSCRLQKRNPEVLGADALVLMRCVSWRFCLILSTSKIGRSYSAGF